MHPELPHTLTIFNQLFRLAEAHVEKEPDVLCWACLAAGALSECEHEESQDAFHEKRPFSAGVCGVFEWFAALGGLFEPGFWHRNPR